MSPMFAPAPTSRSAARSVRAVVDGVRKPIVSVMMPHSRHVAASGAIGAPSASMTSTRISHVDDAAGTMRSTWPKPVFERWWSMTSVGWAAQASGA
ncbi:MAG: hypothetical protein U0470_14575 [Anaerolineae bacterium]